MSASALFARELGAIDRIVEFTAEAFAQEGIEPDLRTVVDLALEELFTNVIKYGRPSEKPVRIELARIANGVQGTIVVEDAERYDPTARPEVDVRRPIEERTPGGLGIHLVRRMMDSFEYRYSDESREARMTFRKTLAGAGAQGGQDARD